jgi:hypothetical protein
VRARELKDLVRDISRRELDYVVRCQRLKDGSFNLFLVEPDGIVRPLVIIRKELMPWEVK